MRSIRIFHPCLPEYDNLGDIAANASIAPMFSQRGLNVDLVDDDIWARRKASVFLDERIDEINREFDMVMIGPGGFLGPKLINSIFKDPRAWGRLTIPLVFNGVGIVASVGKPVWYSTMDKDSHVIRALNRADAVSVRELNSWLLASRALGANSSRLLLGGCPSIKITRLMPPLAKNYDLALNLSFLHEVCRYHSPEIMRVAKILHARGGSVLWVCHSKADADQATEINRQFGFDIVWPKNANEAGVAYAACRFALVTRFHAGIFCLANTVPFAFIGYDMKCWHLLAMLADEPYQYLLPIDHLAKIDMKNELTKMLDRLAANENKFRAAENLLLAHFEEQLTIFIDTVIDALRGG